MMNWLTNLLNKGNELKPTFGQEYLTASGYNDSREEIHHFHSPNIREMVKCDDLKINIQVITKFTEYQRFCCDLCGVKESEILKLIANKSNHMEDILKFLNKNIDGYTLVCNIYMVNQEATLIYRSTSKCVSRPISKILIGHHIILCVKLTQPVYDHVLVETSLRSLINGGAEGNILQYFSEDSVALIDYTDTIEKPAVQILIDLKDYPFKNDISLFVEVPNLVVKKIEVNKFVPTAVKTIFTLKRLIYLLKERFSCHSNYVCGKNPISSVERDNVAKSIIEITSKLKDSGASTSLLPYLSVLHNRCKMYEQEYLFALYQNSYLPSVNQDLEKNIDAVYQIIKRFSDQPLEKELYGNPPEKAKEEEENFEEKQPNENNFQANENNDNAKNDEKTETKPLNILFIGESGAGKQMAVNSIYNYLNYSFDELSEADSVNCILPCQFLLQTRDLKHVAFKAGPQKNESEDNGGLQLPKIYSLTTTEFNIKIIDTPTLKDTRILDVINLVQNTVMNIHELHAICLVIPSYISKLKENLETYLKDFFSLFPKTAAKNLFFFFTFATSTFYKCGDSQNSLEDFIKSYKHPNYPEIQFNQKNICFIDSQALMYFIATKQGHKYQNHEKVNIRLSWNNSKEKIETFLKKLVNIDPIKSCDILMTNGPKNILYGSSFNLGPSKFYECEKKYWKISVEYLSNNNQQDMFNILKINASSMFQTMIEDSEKLQCLEKFLTIKNVDSQIIFCDFFWAPKFVSIKNGTTKETSDIYCGHHILLFIPVKDTSTIDKAKLKKSIAASVKNDDINNLTINLRNNFSLQDKIRLSEIPCKMLIDFQNVFTNTLKDLQKDLTKILNGNFIPVYTTKIWWMTKKQINLEISLAAIKLGLLSSELVEALCHYKHVVENENFKEDSYEVIIENLTTLCNAEIYSYSKLYVYIWKYNKKFWNDNDKSYFYELNGKENLENLIQKFRQLLDYLLVMNGWFDKIIVEANENILETINVSSNNNGEAASLKEEMSKKLLNEFPEENVPPRPLSPDNHNIFALPKRIQTENENTSAVGIDLGTSRCCVVVNRKSGIETVALENTGERLLPSYVAYDEEHTKCGQIAIDRLRYFSEATVFDSKRMIGKNVVVVDKIWPFKVVNVDNQALIKLKTERGEIQQTATEVAAVLLKYMKNKAEQFQGKKLSNVVITVPAAFTKAQEEATKEAAILAGRESVTLLPEPIAAAFAYFIDRPIPNNSILLLFDLGGGTLDVCVFKIINDQIQIISKNGDSKLGGRDFDNLLMDYFSNKLNIDYNISKLGNKKYKLLIECQKIKHNLSVRNDDRIDVEDIDPTKPGLIRITEQNFHDLAEDLLNKIQNTIFSALYKSRHTEDQIDKVLQVGGGCRMPMIKQLLQEIFPSAEHCCEEHPDEVVAIGAAYYAYNNFSN